MTPITVQLDPVSMVAGGLLCFAAQAVVLVLVAIVMVARRQRQADGPTRPTVVK